MFCVYKSHCDVNHGFVASVFLVLYCAYNIMYRTISWFGGIRAFTPLLFICLTASSHHVLLRLDLARPVIRLIALTRFTVWEIPGGWPSEGAVLMRQSMRVRRG